MAEDYLADALAAGRFASREEAVAAGLVLLRDRDAARAAVWPVGGGECGALIRSRDWSTSPLGPPAEWSLELRATVANIVNSPVAKVLMWGSEHIMLYNDAYIAIAGAKHPAAFGGTVPGIWPEIWDWNRIRLERGLRGEVEHFGDQPITLERGRARETLVMDLYYTPVYDADGSVGGVMCTCVDNSARVAAEVRLAASEADLRRITDAVPMLISYVDRDEIYRFVNSTYEQWFGRTRESILGITIRELIGDPLYETRREGLQRALAGEPVAAVLAQYGGQGFGTFKPALADLLVAKLGPIRDRFVALKDDREALDAILARGAAKARERGMPTLDAAYKALGLVRH